MKKILLLAALLVMTLPVSAKEYTATIADNEVAVISMVGDSDLDEYKACAHVYGTFGGGTFTPLVSTDNGTTKSALEFTSGTGRSFESAGNFCWVWQTGNSTIFYMSADGSTSASVTVDVFDNQ